MKYLFAIIIIGVLVSCEADVSKTALNSAYIQEEANGTLFIIGGGGRPGYMVDSLIRISELDKSGYMVVLPMSSSEPDTSAYYSARQFKEQGVEDIHVFNIQDASVVTQQRLDSVRNANLIYITGGDQRQFMDIVRDTEVEEAIRTAFKQGSVVAGTSAGAAMMSEKMITGDEKKHPEYTGDFRTIEADNMIIKSGLGLLENVVIDQHFIERMRMNRLLTVVLEHPGITGVGIDESTAVMVSGNHARVVGERQVIVVRNTMEEVSKENGLLRGQNLDLSVYLPGDRFELLKDELSSKL